MAHAAKYSRGSVGHLIKHYERAKDRAGEYIKFSNENIDAAKTELNYNLAAPGSALEYLHQRLSEVQCAKRKDLNVMCSWVVTAPEDLQCRTPEEIKNFFREVYKFSADRYGEVNVISAYVHMDEVSPHIHFAFVPVVHDKEKNLDKVSAKDCITRYELGAFQQALSHHCNDYFGMDIGLLKKDGIKRDLSINKLKEISVKEAKVIGSQIDSFRQRALDFKNMLRTTKNGKKSLKGEYKLSEDDFNRLYGYAESLNNDYWEMFSSAIELQKNYERMKKTMGTSRDYEELIEEKNNDLEQENEFLLDENNLLKGFLEQIDSVEGFEQYVEKLQIQATNEAMRDRLQTVKKSISAEGFEL
jgi:hypothetical protein